AHQLEVAGFRWRQALQQRAFHAFVQDVFRHGPIRSPLSTGYRHQSAGTDQHSVLAADLLGVVAFVLRRPNQWTQPHPYAPDVGPRWWPRQEFGRLAKNEFDLFRECKRLS